MKTYRCRTCGLEQPMDRFYFVGTYRRADCITCFNDARSERAKAKAKAKKTGAAPTVRPPRPGSGHPWR